MAEEIIVKEASENERRFKLSNGSECVIVKGKGKDVSEAMKISSSDEGKYLFALIARVTTIDNSPIVMEDLDELSMSDVMKIQAEFSEINF